MPAKHGSQPKQCSAGASLTTPAFWSGPSAPVLLKDARTWPGHHRAGLRQPPDHNRQLRVWRIPRTFTAHGRFGRPRQTTVEVKSSVWHGRRPRHCSVWL